MAARSNESDRPAEPGARGGAARFEAILGEHIERLNAGEALDLEAIRGRHPEIAEDLIAELRFFQELGREPALTPALEVLGDYTLRRQIGRGGMGVVYDAWQGSLDRRVALKVLPPAVAADARVATRFLREAQITARLSHPSIVSVYASGVEGSTPYYAMEHVEGETLAAILGLLKEHPEAAPTPWGERGTRGYHATLAEAFAGVAEGLQHAHSKQVIHRDIKPSNLILDRERHLRILDFGLARLEGLEAITLSGDLLGTPQYMSPEQARRSKVEVDYRTDVWSLGATMYEALALRPPFQGKDPQDTLSRIIEDEPPGLRSLDDRVPRDLETIVLKCLRKEPKERFGTAEALAQDLRRFARGDAIEARPPTRWERLRRRMWRKRLPLGLAAVGLALVAALGLLAFEYARTQGAVRENQYLSTLAQAAEELHLNGISGRLTQSYQEGLQRDLEALIPGGGTRGRLKARLAELDAARSLQPARPEAAFNSARILLALQRDADAEVELKALIAQHPRFAPARALLTLVAERRGDKALATARLGELQRTDVDGRAQPWHEAQSAASRRDWPAASAAWTKTLKLGEGQAELYPGADLDALVGRGVARMSSGDLFGACADFATASGRWPGALGPVLLEAQALLLHHHEPARAAADAWLQAAFERISQRDELALRAAGLYLDDEVRDAARAHAWVDRIARQDLAERARLATHLGLGEWQAAATLGERLLIAAPGDALVTAYLADAYSWIPGRVEKSLELAEGLALREDLSPFSLLALSQVYYFTRPALCIRLLERAYAQDPESSEVRLALAYAYNWDRHVRQADGILATFTETELENNPSLLYLRGVQARFKGDSDLGRRCLERSVRAPGNRKRFASWLFWAEIPWQAGEYEEAERIFREGMNIAPNFMLRRIFALFLDETGRYDEALQHFCLALPDESVFEWWQVKEIQRGLSRLLRWKPRPRDLSPLDGFLEAFGKFEEERYTPLVCENLALAYLLAPRGRDVSRARALADQAVAMSERKNPEILASLAMIQLKQGDREAAVETLEEAGARPGAKTQCFEQLAEYRRAILPRIVSLDSCEALLGDAGAGTEEIIDRWKELATTNADRISIAKYIEGCVLDREDDIPGALAAFQAAANEAPDRAEPVLRVADLLRRARRPEEAEKILGQAIAGGCEPSWDLWVEWMRVCEVSLGLTPTTMLERFPIAPDSPAPAPLAGDMRWLLEALSSGRSLAIDCASDEDGVFDGTRWSRDRFFVGPSFRGTATELIDPRPVGPHRTWSGFDEDVAFGGYRVPLPRGKYRVTLLFADYRNDRANLAVWIEGERVLKGYQALREVGWATPDSRIFEVEVTDGVLDIQLKAAEGRRQFPVSIAGVEVERLNPAVGTVPESR